MTIFVIICNLLITVLNIYIFVKVWRWRRNFANIANTLNKVEKQVHKVLYPGPEFIAKGEKGTNYLRQRIKKLKFQLEQLDKLGNILILAYRIWKWQNLGQKSRKGK